MIRRRRVQALTDDVAVLRETMVAHVRARVGAASEPVVAALRTVPRHLFLPDLPPESAYRDEAIVTKRDADGQPISSSSQPTIMALMLDQLGLQAGQRVLEVGAGTGYNAALIAHIVGVGGSVLTVDIDQDVVEQARANLRRAGCDAVRVVCADGAAGLADHAPYDRVIATVGVWDLAPAWLDQLTPAGRIVVPLDVGGVHLSVAFERAGDHWASRSVVPCGFMTMRGLLAGPERTRATGSGLSISVFDGRPIDAEAVSTALAGPVVERTTDVVVTPASVFDGVSLWLAAQESRWCTLSEDGAAAAARLARAPLRVQDRNIAVGLLDGTSLAVLARQSDAEPAFPVSALGYGPRGAALADALAGHLRAWQDAGRPGTASLRLDAYPRPAADVDHGPGHTVIDKRHTRLVLSNRPD